jgi:phytanoyl-CoA hydroxylase
MDVLGGRFPEGVSKGSPQVVGVECQRIGDAGSAECWVRQVVGDERCRPSCDLGGGGMVTRGGGRLERDLGQHQLQVASGSVRREDRCILVVEQMLEERAKPIGAGDRTRLSSTQDPEIDAVSWHQTRAEADPVEPGLMVQILVAIVAMAGLKEYPLGTTHREPTIFLSDPQHSGLHDDQLVHRQGSVGVPAHQSRWVDAGFDHRRRSRSGRRPLTHGPITSLSNVGIVPHSVGEHPRFVVTSEYGVEERVGITPKGEDVLTKTDIDRFHRDGVLMLRGLFSDQEIHALQEAADQVTEEALAGTGRGHGYRDVDGRKQYYRTDGVLWTRHAAFRMATVNPKLLSAVGQCLGHPFMPINDSLVVKLPHSGVAIPWHQDPPYEGSDGLAETFGIPNFDCDIYLDEATIDNGCLYGLAGYHLSGHVEVERFAEEELYERADAIPLEMAPGDVLFHAISSPHGSKANDSNTLRRVFYVHYMAQEVLESLHPEWVGTKRGFAERDNHAARAMVDERVRAGMSGPHTAEVELTPHGFVFTGDPVTPPRHWVTLIAERTPQLLRATKTLIS